MKYIPILALSFFLLSCINSNVDLSTSASVGEANLQVVGGETISQINSPALKLVSYYPDVLVSKLAVYDNDSCLTESKKVGEINNLLGSIVNLNNLAEGVHHFSYKPIFEKNEMNQTAPCYFSGLSYTVDQTAPADRPLIIAPAILMSESQSVNLSISNCEHTSTGSWWVAFNETGIAPSANAQSTWVSCQGMTNFIVTAGDGFKPIYAFTKDLAGNISLASFPLYYHLAHGNGATLSFGSYAGPGGALGGIPSLTNLNVTVGGDQIQSYQYKLGNGSIDCSIPTGYSSDIPSSQTIIQELAQKSLNLPDGGLVKLCVLERDTLGNLQAYSLATSSTWTKNLLMQNLLQDYPSGGVLTFDNAKPSNDYITRNFLVGGGVTSVSLSCGAGCAVDKNNSGTYSSNPILVSAADVVTFKLVIGSSPNTINYLNFSLNGQPFQFQVRSAPLNFATSSKTMFLSMTTNTGFFMGSLSGADQFCFDEAVRYFGSPAAAKSWKALLSLNSTPGLSRLTQAGQDYGDVATNAVIVRNAAFVNTFSHFIDGTPTNGGGHSQALYIPEAPRSIGSTKIWYGGTSGCNCDGWSSNDNSSTCSVQGGVTGFAVSGFLTHNSSSNFFQDYILGGDGTINSYIYASCTESRHIICFEN